MLPLAMALLGGAILSPGPAYSQRDKSPERETFPETSPRSPQRPPRDAQSGERTRPPAKDGKAAEAPPPKPIPQRMRPPGTSSVPQGGEERAKLLDELYARLATAEDEQVANRIATAIERVWLTPGSDTVALLIERARRAVGEKQHDLALSLLDRASRLAPDYPEVFNNRAAVHFARNNLKASVGDLRRVLALEPNHFKALETLGQIFKESGSKKAALEVYRKLHQVHPHMSGVKSALDELEREVNGQDS
jgi:tetratricopeptide (TPR) repeat protein